jgi:hypothetical protein
MQMRSFFDLKKHKIVHRYLYYSSVGRQMYEQIEIKQRFKRAIHGMLR